MLDRCTSLETRRIAGAMWWGSNDEADALPAVRSERSRNDAPRKAEECAGARFEQWARAAREAGDGQIKWAEARSRAAGYQDRSSSGQPGICTGRTDDADHPGVNARRF